MNYELFNRLMRDYKLDEDQAYSIIQEIKQAKLEVFEDIEKSNLISDIEPSFEKVYTMEYNKIKEKHLGKIKVIKIKRKDKEIDKCTICGRKTSRKLNFHRNQRRKYDVFVCKKCRPMVAGGQDKR